jgi:hypothetical protein
VAAGRIVMYPLARKQLVAVFKKEEKPGGVPQEEFFQTHSFAIFVTQTHRSTPFQQHPFKLLFGRNVGALRPRSLLEVPNEGRFFGHGFQNAKKIGKALGLFETPLYDQRMQARIPLLQRIRKIVIAKDHF